MGPRVPFSDDDDALLMKFIATYNPQRKGRLGMILYERLVANEEGKWSFASRHTANSWRERYKTNQLLFDAKILKYQKKHGISANSPPPVGRSESKKRAREVNTDDLSPEPSPAKKMRRENVTVQGSRASGLPPRAVSPRVEPPNKGKLRAELSPSPRPEDNGDLPVTGPDDYNGALSDESDHVEDSQSDGGQGNESSSSFPPSSPITKTRSKHSASLKHSSRPGRVVVSAAPEDPPQPLASSSRQQHTATHPSVQAAPKASSSARNLANAPLQLSQEPTPPHSSALDSPSSPLIRQRSHTTSPPPQSGTVHKHQRVAPLKQRRSYRIVQEEEDDIFCTPPIQSPTSSPPPRTRARDAPRLVEGPYRSSYYRAKGGHRPAPHGRVPKDVEANGNEWPQRRSKRDASMSSSERPTAADMNRASVQHIDLRVLHSRKSVERFRSGSNTSFGSSSRTLENKRPQKARAPRSSTTSNLSESNKELVLALGLEEVYKRMADNHKFHVDIVREVAAGQRSLEQADQMLRSMREAAEHEYARLVKREYGVALGTGAQESEESDEEEEEEEVAENLGNDEEPGPSTPPQLASPRSNHSQPELSMTNGGGCMEDDADAMELDEVPTNQAESSLPGSPALPNVEWSDEDDELLLDGDLAAHEDLVRRKGLGSVKFRTAHLYSLLLEG